MKCMNVSGNLKKISLVLVVCLSSTLFGQGPSDCGTNRDELIVGSNFSGRLGYPPFEVLDQDEVLEGFDVAVAIEVAHRLGFKLLTFRNTSFNALLDEVATGQNIDIALSAISITQMRNDRQDIGFVKYNNDDNLGLLIVPNLAQVPGVSDPETALEVLNTFAADTVVPIAVVEGSRQEAILRGPDYTNLVANIQLFDNVTQAVDGMLPAPITTAVLFTDGPTVRDLAVTNPDLLVPIENVAVAAASDIPSQGLGIAISTECCQLYANIDQAIKDMTEDGTLQLLRDEFNVGTFTPDDLTPLACAGTEPTINSNAIYNWLFSKFCPEDVNVGVIT